MLARSQSLSPFSASPVASPQSNLKVHYRTSSPLLAIHPLLPFLVRLASPEECCCSSQVSLRRSITRVSSLALLFLFLYITMGQHTSHCATVFPSVPHERSSHSVISLARRIPSCCRVCNFHSTTHRIAVQLSSRGVMCAAAAAGLRAHHCRLRLPSCV